MKRLRYENGQLDEVDARLLLALAAYSGMGQVEELGQARGVVSVVAAANLPLVAGLVPTPAQPAMTVSNTARPTRGGRSLASAKKRSMTVSLSSGLD